MTHTRLWRTGCAAALSAVLACSVAACSTVDAPASSGEASSGTASSSGATAGDGTATGKGEIPQPSKVVPAATSDGLPAMGFWAVWCVSSRSAAGVTPMQNRLEAQGFPTEVVYSPEWEKLDVSPWYVLLIGPYSKKQTAEEALSVAKSLGYKEFYVQFSGPTTVDQGAGFVKSGATRGGVSK